jgi:P27 family predicted phage terminase small subunit
MKGRKPIPTALHKSRGTLNTTRHEKGRAGEPIANGDLIDAPDWMTEGQQASWRYAIENAPLHLLKRIDRGVLAVWVIAEEQHRLAAMAQARMDAISAMPMLVKDRFKQAMASPYVGLTHRAGLRMLKAASELGFSPAARPRIASGAAAEPPAPDESPWARLRVLQGGKPA